MYGAVLVVHEKEIQLKIPQKFLLQQQQHAFAFLATSHEYLKQITRAKYS